MSSNITLLSDDVINQIAAGEVIEHPASVVKELVDNAIDAEARSIRIEIQGGGQQLIKVEDDGCGMGRADVELCLLRHATSKLKQVSDLDSLCTMGFRGEALAAIASISKLELRTSNRWEAVCLKAEGGHVESILPSARGKGTTIEVRSLFFNAPARRKFQKSLQTNRTQIVRVVQSLALAFPNIAFSLVSQEQTLLSVEVGTWQERIRQIFGDEYCKSGQWIEQKGIYGLLADPEEAKTTRLGQYLFLNQRPIFSPLLSKAVQEAYGTRISEGSHPSFLLFLNRSPEEFDVNVHPQKREVRFQDESALFRSVRDSVQKALYTPAFFSTSPVQETVFIRPESQAWSFREELAPISCAPQTLFTDEPKGKPLAVVGSFLLAQSNEELVLVDLSEAYEEKVLHSSGSQTLIWPLEYSLSHEEALRQEEIIERMKEAGFEARMVGFRHCCLDALPDWLDSKNVPDFLEVLKEDLWRGYPVQETLRRFCKLAPKCLTLEEAALMWNKSKNARQVCIDAADLKRIYEQ